MYLSIYLSVYLSICLSVYLSICLSIYLSIYLSAPRLRQRLLRRGRGLRQRRKLLPPEAFAYMILYHNALIIYYDSIVCCIIL